MSEAVAVFLRPLSGVPFLSPLEPLGVVPFVASFAFLSSSDEEEWGFVFEAAGSEEPFVSFSACFLRFLLPGAFLSACVRPFSLRVLIRRLRRARSVGTVGRMGITSFSA